MRLKIYIIIGMALIAGVFLVYKFSNRRSAMDKFAAGGPVKMKTEAVSNVTTDQLTPIHCPEPEALVKQELKWTTRDKKWENYTPSSATRVLNFIGAQWLGIKVGKVICLYQTDEEVAFPLALEQTRAQSILEPQGFGWSSLIGSHKLCKSASIADCPYFVEPPRNPSNIYDEIKYAPAAE